MSDATAGLRRIDDYLCAVPRPRWLGIVVLALTVAIILAMSPATRWVPHDRNPLPLLLLLPLAPLIASSRYGIGALVITSLAVLQPVPDVWWLAAAVLAVRGVLGTKDVA